jgi:hypothetical protein
MRLALLAAALLLGLGAVSLVSSGSSDRYGVGAVVPVSGQLTLNGKPLRLKPNAFARVWFYPDASKGNNCPQVASGDVDAQGHYQLSTRGRDGAAPGWYRVMVIATEHVDPNQPSRRRPSFVAARYGSPQTSGLAVRVVEAPSAGAYDLHLRK